MSLAELPAVVSCLSPPMSMLNAPVAVAVRTAQAGIVFPKTVSTKNLLSEDMS